MAIAFARVSIHSRNQGHSAVAGAAYRSGSYLMDERTGEEHHYENRHDVVHTEILLPESADERFKDRNYLWNRVELCEKRKDAQVAKDIILALPRDVSRTHQIELARSFADYHYVSKGLVADIAIHDHSDGNPHAHIYITTRRLLGNQFDVYKARDLNPTFGKGKNGKSYISEQEYWGEQWRNFQNSYFEKNNIDFLVDENHLISQRHEGRVRSREDHYLKEENEIKRAACIEIALNDPESLLNIISQRYAVFSERQFVNLLFKSTTTKEEFSEALLKIKQHPEIICLGVGHDGELRYTTRANYHKEVKFVEQAEKLSKQFKHSISGQLEKVATQYSLTDEQTKALHHIIEGADLGIIVGRAGTGKSYLMKAAHEVLSQAGYRVMGIAVSGIAAKGLKQSSHIPSSTVASFKLKILKGFEKLKANDVIIMDEAGMTNLHDMAFVIEAVKSANAKLVLVGDPDQLQPIGAGAPFRALTESLAFVELEAIRRQIEPGDQQATQHLASGDVVDAFSHYESKNAFHWHATREEAVQSLVERWSSDLLPKDLSNHLILAHRNVDIQTLNQLARSKLIEKGWISREEHSFEVLKRVPSEDGWHVEIISEKIQLACGDRILFQRNDSKLGIMNGEFGTVTKINGQMLSVKLDDNREITFDAHHYRDFNYGYAATIHKAQGITKDKIFVYVGGQGWNRHLAYVVLSRHRECVEVHIDHETFSTKEKLLTSFSRKEVKDSVLDWPFSYARRRGFDPESLIGRWLEKIGHLKETIHDKWLFLANYDVYLQKRRNQEIPTKNDLSTFVENPNIEWDRLKEISDTKWLCRYRELALEKKEPLETAKIYQSMQNLMEKISEKQKLMGELKEKTPTLAAFIEDTITLKHQKKPMRNSWQDPEYQQDFEKLRTINDSTVQWIVKFYDLSREKSDPKKVASINKSIDDLVIKLAKKPSAFENVQRIAQVLAKAFKQYIEMHSKGKNKGIERDF